MKTLLSFLGGASLVFIFGTLGLCQTSPGSSTLIALGWFGGIIVGAWAVGMAMFLFGNMVGNTVAEHVVPRRRPPEILQATPIDEVEVIEDESSIYDDPDWWKDEKKRRRHRRNGNG